ncbi:leucine-rich repeat domain-containing protein [Clostridium cadaveris]|uniref:leucine-rich repeat domain-containing protein n=2 Tax=Clostridium TaxID=1485 RepID=UPI001E3AE3E5|nr:leucine-rich repeat domain-containing protein [Clostridium cadaveris]UFH63582.1 leucine-rich repeat domain-containing protein [Clostridium cadaveris]
MGKKNKFITALLSFIMLLSIGAPNEVKAYVLNRNEIEVEIAPDDIIQDQMLNWVIRTSIHKTPDRSYAKLTKEDLEKDLPEIYYSESDHYDLYEFNVFVKSIEGLQYATNTERILLPYNKISDLKPISNLTKLTKIVMNDNPVSDLTPLSNLVNLEILNLGDNKITNIEPLANLTKLERLNLELNFNINDIDVVKNFTKLKYLNLGYNSISDLTPLKELTYLEDGLILGNNKIQDISPLADITKLKELDISSNNISDISVLKNLRNLKFLRLSNNSAINDIAPLTNLTKLDKNGLWLTGTGIEDKKDDLFKVINVNKLINKFKANYITLEDKEYVEAAREAYNALAPELKKYIPELRIIAAEENIARIEKGEQRKQYSELSEFDKQPIELGDFKTLQFKIEDKNGQPLSGVKFNLQTSYGYTEKELISDENGIVSHTIFDAYRYMDYQIVLVDKDKYTSNIEKITFKTDGTPKIVEVNGKPATGTEKLKFVLEVIDQDEKPSVDSSTLQFKVVDKNENPISGVKFNINDQNDEAVASLTSDENGIARYKITSNMTYMDFTVDIADKNKYTAETEKITFKVGAKPEIVKINRKAFTGKEDLKFVIAVNGKVDKTSLKKVIKEAESKDVNKYTEESYKQLTDALVYAKTILTKTDATQEEVDTITKNIQEAIAKLVEEITIPEGVDDKTLKFRVVNKNAQLLSGVKFKISNNYNKNVVEVISDENGIVKYTVPDWMIYMNFKVELADNDKYTSETNNIIFTTGSKNNALYIKEVNGKPFTSKENFDFILKVADEDIKPEVDKTKLENAIKDAESRDANRYTEESYKQLTDALVYAKTILEKSDATQEEVDKNTAEVVNAIDKLVEKSITSEVAQEKQNVNNEEINTLPKTGGVSTGMSVLFGSLLSTIGAIIVLSKKTN